MKKVRMAVLGMNQGSKTARDAVKHPEVDLVAVAGQGDHDREIAAELGVLIYTGRFGRCMDLASESATSAVCGGRARCWHQDHSS